MGCFERTLKKGTAHIIQECVKQPPQRDLHPTIPVEVPKPSICFSQPLHAVFGQLSGSEKTVLVFMRFTLAQLQPHQGSRGRINV